MHRSSHDSERRKGCCLRTDKQIRRSWKEAFGSRGFLVAQAGGQENFKSPGLGKKRLALEAFLLLKQVVDKRNASHQTVFAWKMNELTLVDKTHNENMANRELHVLRRRAR
jgi:hypothetical protein